MNLNTDHRSLRSFNNIVYFRYVSRVKLWVERARGSFSYSIFLFCFLFHLLFLSLPLFFFVSLCTCLVNRKEPFHSKSRAKTSRSEDAFCASPLYIYLELVISVIRKYKTVCVLVASSSIRFSSGICSRFVFSSQTFYRALADFVEKEKKR